ncbi:MAG: cupredoxin domain-containing protein [Solirubrobacterales bacterium]
MNSLLNKRLPGILALGLVMLAVGAAGSPASAAMSGGAQISGLTKAQQKAKAKALKKCGKKSTAKKRKACKRAVVKKYKRLANATPSGKTYKVNLYDNYFTPANLAIKVNDIVEWSWATVGEREPHNVTLANSVPGVNRSDYVSELTTDKDTRFKRAFPKPGAYKFVCEIHFAMTMDVNVSK